MTATQKAPTAAGSVVQGLVAGQHGEDRDVDRVARAADQAEFEQLPLARRPAGGGADSVREFGGGESHVFGGLRSEGARRVRRGDATRSGYLCSPCGGGRRGLFSRAVGATAGALAAASGAAPENRASPVISPRNGARQGCGPRRRRQGGHPETQTGATAVRPRATARPGTHPLLPSTACRTASTRAKLQRGRGRAR